MRLTLLPSFWLCLALLVNVRASGQGYVALNVYQIGSTSFQDDPIGQRTLNTGSVLCDGQGLSTDDEYFWGLDASTLMRMLVMSGGTRDEFLHKEDDGFEGLDMPTLSMRLGKMGGTVGFGVDADVRALFFRGPVDSLPAGAYSFNSDKYISDFNFGPVLTAYFRLGDYVTLNPTVGYGWMFLEREATPVDGHLFLIENCLLLKLAGPVGVNVETDLQLRRMKMDESETLRSSTMFCLKFGLSYQWE